MLSKRSLLIVASISVLVGVAVTGIVFYTSKSNINKDVDYNKIYLEAVKNFVDSESSTAAKSDTSECDASEECIAASKHAGTQEDSENDRKNLSATDEELLERPIVTIEE